MDLDNEIIDEDYEIEDESEEITPAELIKKLEQVNV